MALWDQEGLRVGPGVRDAVGGTDPRGGPDKPALQVTTLLHFYILLIYFSSSVGKRHNSGITKWT